MINSYDHLRKTNLSELGKLARLLKENKLAGTHSSGVTRHYLNTGYPPLNQIVSGDHNGGLPSGQLVMIAGPSACGKTMISTQLMISAQKQGGFAAFFDYETQYQMELALLQGLDPNEEKFQYYKPTTFEEGIGGAIKLAKLIRDNNIIDKDAPIVFVFDSLHAMTPQSKYDNLMGKKGAIETGTRTSMHDNYALAKALADWSATISREFDRYGITGVFLNQVRTETDTYGNEHFKFPGGDTLYFYCSTVLVLTAKDLYEGKGDDKVLRNKDIKALTVKSRNARPMQNVHWDFTFDDKGTGNFDVIGSYTDFLLDIGAIETAGAWIKFMGKTFQGRDKVIDYFRGQPDGVEQLKKIHQEHKDNVLTKA
jgi:RecA/RadA recombinase